MINRFRIRLTAGMEPQEVREHINQFSSLTKAFAVEDQGVHSLHSMEFGTNATISVISDVASNAFSTGFGNTFSTDLGVNIVGKVDGVETMGWGNEIDSRGVLLRFATDPYDPASTVHGYKGKVSVFTVIPEPSAAFALFVLSACGLTRRRTARPSIKSAT